MRVNERNSSIELLRIFCMFGIVFMHVFGYVYQDPSYRIVSLLENGLFNSGVTILVLISGFYSINVNIKKIINFEFIAYFSSVIFLIIYINNHEVNISNLIACLFPFLSGNNKFYSGFILLMILSPFVNKFFNTLSRDMYKIIIVTLVLFFYISPCILLNNYNLDYGKGFTHYFIAYIIGRYIAINYDVFKKIKNIYMVILIIVCFCLAFTFNSLASNYFQQNYILFSLDNSIYILIQSICIFLLFERKKYYNKIINKLASYNFAVFLYNNIIISYLLKGTITTFISAHSRFANIVFLIGIVLLSHVVCIIMEIIRKILFGKISDKFISSLCTKLENISIIKSYLRY